MKDKLATFQNLCAELYPHELDYLLSINQFQKKENVQVLQLVYYNTINPDNPIPFDKSLDKRTYSYIKSWILDNLQKIDVDVFYDWVSGVERIILNDSIQSADEKQLLKIMEVIKPTDYYFMKFFRVIQHYRDYLLVRNRPHNYELATDFLTRNKSNYLYSQSLNNKMNEAAEKVIYRKIWIPEEFNVWEKLFSDIYYNETIDGYTRYRAVVRLTILYYTQREFDKLKLVYQHLDQQFKTPVFYSKRILANYYANRAMMHSKLNELEEAEKFGMLSIRHRNSDYLFYLVNLCDVLLRANKAPKALKLLVNSFPELKISGNFYYKIGFASLYIKTLVANNMIKNAIDYGEIFLNGYKNEIFEYRWHLFFSSYIGALFRFEKYSKILSLGKRYKLCGLERQLLGTAQYLPIIQLYMLASEYMEGVITKDKLRQAILQHIQEVGQNRFRHRKVLDTLKTLSLCIPDVISGIMVTNQIHEEI